MATDEGESKTTKRCPRCETTKHRTEFTSLGYCRPCSRDYHRERSAKKREEAGPPAPRPRKPATIRDVVRNVEARKANGETKSALPETIAPSAETIGAPRETSRPPDEILGAIRISDPDRRRLLLRALGAALVHVLEDGEELTLSALRVGSCIVIEGIDVSGDVT